MQTWEYRFVNTTWKGDHWYVLSVNGKELGDWHLNVTMYDDANRIGEEGWN